MDYLANWILLQITWQIDFPTQKGLGKKIVSGCHSIMKCSSSKKVTVQHTQLWVHLTSNEGTKACNKELSLFCMHQALSHPKTRITCAESDGRTDLWPQELSGFRVGPAAEVHTDQVVSIQSQTVVHDLTQHKDTLLSHYTYHTPWSDLKHVSITS